KGKLTTIMIGGTARVHQCAWPQSLDFLKRHEKHPVFGKANHLCLSKTRGRPLTDLNSTNAAHGHIQAYGFKNKSGRAHTSATALNSFYSRHSFFHQRQSG